MWTTPKTNWINGEYFNLTPDYDRIKGNIEHLIALSAEIYTPYPTTPLESPTIADYPTASFFNKVVDDTKAILDNCYSPIGTREMRNYVANGEAWNADDLNAIESNHLRLYQAFMGQIEGIPKVEFTLGGTRF